MNKQTLALLQEAKEETRSDSLRQKLARAIYQATFPRIGDKGRYSKEYYRKLSPLRLEELIHAMKWSVDVTRKRVEAVLRGRRNQTLAQVRELLAHEERHYHNLTKELWRRQNIKFRWARASEAGRKVFIGNRLLSTGTSS